MKPRRSLFEVINKAPQTESAIAKPRLSLFKRKTSAKSPPIVAQALTEEEAAAELSARRARAEAEALAAAEARERVAREKEQKRLAKLERKSARQAARQSAKQRAAELAAQRQAQKAASSAQSSPVAPIIRSGRSRLSFSLSTAGFMVVAGVTVGVIFAAYAIGKKFSGGEGSTEITRAAAVKPPLIDEPRSMVKPSATQKNAADGKNKELGELLRPPPAVTRNMVANQPQRIESGGDASAAAPKKENFVQIEWFQISVDKNREELQAELEDVHRFLKARGIETFARELPRGFILYSARGFRMSSDTKADRDAFLRQCQKLGQEYFRGGGRYQFKDCFFVSYNNAMKGQPVTFKE